MTFISRSCYAGFTLVELIVVIGIIGVISVVTVTSQHSFNNTTLLTNTAYDIALSLHSAETFGIGGRTPNAQAVGYGVHFINSGPFLLFADIDPVTPNLSVCHATSDPIALDAQPGDCVYTANSDKTVSSYTLGNGAKVTKLCVYANSTRKCNPTSLDITFSRPNPSALIAADSSYSKSYTKACIQLAAPGGGSYVRSIVVTSVGGITINTSACPLS